MPWSKFRNALPVVLLCVGYRRCIGFDGGKRWISHFQFIRFYICISKLLPAITGLFTLPGCLCSVSFAAFIKISISPSSPCSSFFASSAFSSDCSASRSAFLRVFSRVFSICFLAFSSASLRSFSFNSSFLSSAHIG